MTDDKFEEVRQAGATHRGDLIIQLGGYVGLRVFEIPQISPPLRDPPCKAIAP